MRGGQRVGRLVVHREVAPKRHGHPVDDLAAQTCLRCVPGAWSRNALYHTESRAHPSNRKQHGCIMECLTIFIGSGAHQDIVP